MYGVRSPLGGAGEATVATSANQKPVADVIVSPPPPKENKEQMYRTCMIKVEKDGVNKVYGSRALLGSNSKRESTILKTVDDEKIKPEMICLPQIPK